MFRVTFETKSGDIPAIKVAKSGDVAFGTSASLESGDMISIEDDTTRGTSVPLSGDFTLEFDGQRTGYLPHDATAEQMRAALEDLSAIGDVSIQRHSQDVNNGNLLLPLK